MNNFYLSPNWTKTKRALVATLAFACWSGAMISVGVMFATKHLPSPRPFFEAKPIGTNKDGYVVYGLNFTNQ